MDLPETICTQTPGIPGGNILEVLSCEGHKSTCAIRYDILPASKCIAAFRTYPVHSYSSIVSCLKNGYGFYSSYLLDLAADNAGR